jgi:putative nucleotidyltransferase with HDIG domain
MGGIALTLALALAVGVVGAAQAPDFALFFAVTPTLLVAMLLAIAYDRRSALAYALLHSVLVCLALRESVGMMAVMITGIACVVWSLKEIRDRNSLFRTSIVAAVGVAIATAIFGLIERPLSPDVLPKVLKEIGLDSGAAAGGAMLVGGFVLFLLPVIERAFNVTTGMTLIDLRDPKQPLLKELQFRAPGTYNHSLNVAAVAEAAAESIGCDSLLTYVGALYHDVGKMNKPEYFVENQVGGSNKHDKLSPAMSLLVVVGHVKDGMELAREFQLPQKVQHFIEAHHGTTLVEFFYHRARQQALKGKDGQDLDPEDTYVPDEFEYRYQGPKPRTKEVAILMIADAVESAARAMPEPTPSRIDALVRTIANKRLMDGQFDDCELTLKELHIIVESISRSVTSMHHGRIAYPQGEIEKPVEQRA